MSAGQVKEKNEDKGTTVHSCGEEQEATTKTKLIKLIMYCLIQVE